jgi:hypothetical protein
MAHTLTGRIRYRSTWLGKLVLQVEMQSCQMPLSVEIAPGSIVEVPIYYWRDAKAIDLKPALGGA